VSRPADVPGQDLAEAARSTDAGDDVGRLGVDDLTWREVAEAVWLAAVTRPLEVEPPAPKPKPPPETDEQAVDQASVGQDDQTGKRPTGVRAERPSPRLGPEPARPAAARPQSERELPLRLLAGAAPARGWSLPDRLNFVRALRPLKRKVTSHRIGDVVMDEVATAERALQDELWWPVTKQRRERWLDLTVVVDASPSVALWRSKVDAFVELLEQLGAFRTIRVRRMDTNRSSAGVALPPVLCGSPGAEGARDPAEVVDRSGRRVVLVITDGLANAWRGDLIGPVLAQWARAMPVSVIHLLPQWMWGSCGAALHRARLSASADLRPNRLWSVDLPDAWIEPKPERAFPQGAVAVPVLELDPRWLRWWAHLIVGGHRAPADATVLLVTDKPRPRVSTFEPPTEKSAHQRIAEFRSVASPSAQRLAQLLAALPVDLSIARLIQERFIPGCGGPEIISELITAGLLRYPADTAPHGSTVDTRLFDIALSDREILLEGARRTETARAVRTAAQHHGHRISALALLRDAIADPDNTPDPTSAGDRALERLVMRALSGGAYLSRAGRLSDHAPAHEPGGPADETSDTSVPASIHSPAQPEDEPPADPSESATMSNTAESADLEEARTAISTPTESEEEPGAPDLDVEMTTTPLRPTAFTGSTDKREPGDSPPVWGGVPPRNLNFTGRDDLIDELRSQLTAGGTAAVLPASLHGMGGIGKTQAATEYIYRHLDEYDLVWWIQAAKVHQIRHGLTGLARHLDLPGSSESATAVPAVLEALRRGNPVRRWLLVFDAAESPEVVREYFPSNGPGEILVTSRNPAWSGVARPLEVSVFRREESKELLRRRGPDISDAEADQIADKLGDLPLAIEQAAAWRAETGMPVREYLRLFEEKVAEIFESATSPDYNVSVAAAWNVSFDELRNRNPAAYQILQICAFFSPEPITRDLFTGGRQVSISPELEVALRDPIQLARAIRDINRYGLAKIDHRNNTIQLHRLVQLVLRNRITVLKMQAQMRHGAHQLLANLDPNDPEKTGNWPRYWELLPHAFASGVMDCSDGWVRQLVINLMKFLFRWGEHVEAAKLASDALTDFTTKLGSNDPQTLDVARLLGFYLFVLGRFKEAAELNERTLARQIEISGENSEETFRIQTNVLADLKAQGDFASARRLSEEILLKIRRLLGEDDPETLEIAFLHGVSLRLTGDFAAALELDEDTYRKRVEILGRDHHQTWASYSGVTVDRREAGEYVWARGEAEKLVDQAVEQFGMDRLITQTRIYMLSIARRKDGDHAGALELSHPALEHFRHRYGSKHPLTVCCVLAHSIDLRHAGDLPAARRLGEEAIDSYRDLLGEHHPHTLAAKVDLAVTLRLNGDASGAHALSQRAYEQLRNIVGANHPHTIVSGINLASDLAALGDAEAAVELGNEMLDRSQNVLGPDHPTTLAAAVNMVFDLRVTGDHDTEARYSDVMGRYRRTLSDGHMATVAASRGDRANCDIDPLLM
jgi:tetratricopeptide (TPR) repeat protein